MKDFIRHLFQKLFSKEVLMYLLFGVLTTAVNYMALFILNLFIPEKWVIISNGIAWIAAVLFAYVTNKIWVFQSRSWESRTVVRELASFAAGRVVTLLLEEIGLFFLVNIMSWKVFVAKLLLSVIVIILNYVFSKLLVFAKKKSVRGGSDEREKKEGK